MGEVYVYQISLLCTWAQRPVRDGCLSKQQEAVAWFYGRFRGILDHGGQVFPVTNARVSHHLGYGRVGVVYQSEVRSPLRACLLKYAGARY